jgi:universal stress protein A
MRTSRVQSHFFPAFQKVPLPALYLHFSFCPPRSACSWERWKEWRMLRLKTILHPTDFSDSSTYALDLACGLASDYGASLVIIHVMTAPVVICGGVIFPSNNCGTNHVREKLDEMDIPLESGTVTRRIEEGNPAAEILHMAQVCHADLIVMGSHGRDGLPRWLMGSVAEAVMRKATCPVLTVTAQTGPHGMYFQDRHADTKPASHVGI